MKKVWFIMEDGRRKGPFSTENIQHLLTEGEISLITQIKNQFVSDWKSAGEFSEFVGPSSVAAVDLPDLPEEIEYEEIIVQEEKVDLNDDLLGMPDIPKTSDFPDIPDVPYSPVLNLEKEEKERSSYTLVPEDEEEYSDIDLEDSVVEEEAKTSSKKSIRLNKNFLRPLLVKLSAAIVVLSLVGALTYFLFPESEKVKFVNIDKNNESILRSVQREDFNRKVEVAFSLDKTGDSLWAATNVKGQGNVLLKMKSIDGKIISDSPVEFRSESTLNGGAIQFKKFNIEVGEKIVPGYYDVSITIVPTGSRHKFFKYFKESAIGALGFFDNHADVYDYQGEMLVFGGDQNSFKKKLVAFRKAKIDKVLKFHSDRLEKYKTFISFIDMIKGIYFEALNKMRSGRDTYKYVRPYGKNVAPILQDMVIDNHKKHEKFKSVDKLKASGYLQNLEYGKLVGKFASDLAEMTRPKTIIGPRTRAALRLKANDMATTLKLKGKAKQKQLSAQIKEIRADMLNKLNK